MHKVKFSNVEEFVEDLATYGPDEGMSKIVRYTTQLKPGPFPQIKSLSVIAGCRVGDETITLEQYVGDHTGMDKTMDDKTEERRQTVYKQIDEFAKAHNMRVQGGMYV